LLFWPCRVDRLPIALRLPLHRPSLREERGRVARGHGTAHGRDRVPVEHGADQFPALMRLLVNRPLVERAALLIGEPLAGVV
jgi:hypothetical protein